MMSNKLEGIRLSIEPCPARAIWVIGSVMLPSHAVTYWTYRGICPYEEDPSGYLMDCGLMNVDPYSLHNSRAHVEPRSPTGVSYFASNRTILPPGVGYP